LLFPDLAFGMPTAAAVIWPAGSVVGQTGSGENILVSQTMTVSKLGLVG
jgi:hypothetical protein